MYCSEKAGWYDSRMVIFQSMRGAVCIFGGSTRVLDPGFCLSSLRFVELAVGSSKWQ